MNIYRNRAFKRRFTFTDAGTPLTLGIADTVELRLFREDGVPLLTVTETPSAAGSVVTIGAAEQEIAGVTWPARSWAEVVVHHGDMDIADGQIVASLVVVAEGLRYTAWRRTVRVLESGG